MLCFDLTRFEIVMFISFSKRLCVFYANIFGIGDQKDTDVGPMITPAAKERCERLIQSGIDQGANVSAQLLSGGYFLTDMMILGCSLEPVEDKWSMHS